MLAEAAPGMTFGGLRYAAHRLVLKLDPDAVRRRKERARQDAHVRRFREASGNGGMVARELPSDEVLASWQHVEQRALDLRGAGVPGTLQELRVRAYLDLLQERDSRLCPAAGETGQDGQAAGADVPDQPWGASDGDVNSGPGGDGGSSGQHDGDSGPGSRGPGGPGGPRPGSQPSPGGNGGTGHARPGTRDAGPAVAALVNITVPLAALHGDPAAPGCGSG